MKMVIIIKEKWNKLEYWEDDILNVSIKKPLSYIIDYIIFNKKNKFRIHYCPDCNKKTHDYPYDNDGAFCICGTGRHNDGTARGYLY